MHNDSVQLLGQCDAGIKMALIAIDEVMPGAEDPKLRRTLHMSKTAHEELLQKTHQLLRLHNAPGKEPNWMAKGMNRLNAGVKLTFRPGDASIADLVVSGCNMGIKNLHKYQNQYKAADCHSRDVADKLIGLEADLANSMYPYL
jgi:hypothetical protein